MNTVLVIDTETTGLAPKGYKSVSNSKLWSTCRMVQIAWTLFNADGTKISSEVYVVKPDNFKIPNYEFHGITDEIAASTGLYIHQVFEKLNSVLDKSGKLVAHNMAFDDAVIQSELHRYKKKDILEKWKNIQKECTMMMDGNWLKLPVLYKKHFNREPDVTLHRADNDVMLCADIYFAMVRPNEST